jgi:excisionase family DNA binding protein
MEKYTVSELASLLNVSTTTVRNYIKTGKLVATKIRQGLKHYYIVSDAQLKAFKQNYLNEV